MPIRSRYGLYLPALFRVLSIILARKPVSGIPESTPITYIMYISVIPMPMVPDRNTLVAPKIHGILIHTIRYAPIPPNA